MMQKVQKKVLEEAGWTDKDGDGIREKDDRSFRSNGLLSKQTGASASGRIRTGYVKDIGIDVDINCTADNNSVVQRSGSVGCSSAMDKLCRLRHGDAEWNTGLPCLQSSDDNEKSGSL